MSRLRWWAIATVWAVGVAAVAHMVTAFVLSGWETAAIVADIIAAIAAVVGTVLSVHVLLTNKDGVVLARVIGATLRDMATPTMLKAGYKANVIPSVAEATVDCRILPGRMEAFNRELDEILGPDVEREWLELPPVETTFDGPLVEAMKAAVRAEDPEAHTLPYMLSGGTDAKALSKLGIRCFGFAPLKLPADLDFTALFHGVDERVPVDALKFGTRVLDRFLRSC